MIAERTVGGLVHPEQIEEMGDTLKTVIEVFDRAVKVEALCSIKKAGKHSRHCHAIISPQSLHVDQALLLSRLNYVETGHDLSLCCMAGTRRSILKQTMKWAVDTQGEDDALRRNAYWFYASPGIGKTTLAHSICANLHDRRQLLGAFFCRRDDPNLSDPRNILPTLIYKLAGIFPAFQAIVASHLRNDLNLTPKSMKYTLFLDFIRKLPCHPKRDLVFVIDAFDECGDDKSRSLLLEVLVNATEHASWLKIIVTSRPEVDIQRFFDAPMRYDLGTDEEAKVDLQTFTRGEFKSIASKWYLPDTWPEEPLFNKVVSQANGLFIFIRTFFLALGQCENPKESLETILKGSAGVGMERLYGLYSNILKLRLANCNISKIKQMLGVLLTTAPNRPLCEGAIATLAGVELNLVKKWVDDLSSLLYRDEEANGAIRVRHLSVSEFFVSNHCDYRVILQDAHAQLGIACLETMVEQLRFNICELEDSRLANAQVEGLPTLIKRNISEALQYSSLYWSDHLYFTAGNCDQGVLGGLKKFFEGVYPLFWIEVLSIMGMVPVGAPSLRRMISWVKASITSPWQSFAFENDSNLLQDADSTLLERIQDILHFIIMFHTPVSISAPHTYISTRPFLPSESPLLHVFGQHFSKCIKMKEGQMSSWPARPLELIGHTNDVRSVSYSPNGCNIVTGAFDCTIRIWDAETGTMVGESLEGHQDYVQSVAYSPDGRCIISGSRDKTIRIWDAETGAEIGGRLEGHSLEVRCVVYSPDGRYIISGSDDQTIRVWDGKTGTAVGKPLQGHTGIVWSVAYSPDGRHIISGSGDKDIRVWDAETGALVGNPLQGHTGAVWSIAYSRDGRHVISGSDDQTIRIWDAKTGAVIGKPLQGHTEPVLSVAYSPDGRRIISGSYDRTIRTWDAETSELVGKPLKGHRSSVLSVAYSPNGRYIISGSNDCTIRIWDAETGAAVGEPSKGYTGSVCSVGYSPGGEHIVSGSGDGTIQIWDAETGIAVGKPLEGHTGCTCVAYSPDADGRYIISGYSDGTIRIWEARTGATVGKPLEGHKRRVTSVAYSPDGRHIISGCLDMTVRIWDAEACTAIGKPLDGHTGFVRAVSYSPDGRYLISGSDDMTVRIWDAGTGAPVGKPLSGHTGFLWSVAYSPNGHYIISGSVDKTIRILDAKTGAPIGNPLEHAKPVWSIAYSPDGQHIFSASGDGTILVWEAETQSALGRPVNGHPSSVISIAPSPDGGRIVSGCSDNTIHVWDLLSHASISNSSSSNPMHPYLCAPPDRGGWIRDSQQGLLYWVPPKYRAHLHSRALLTIHLTDYTQSVSLNFEDSVFGTSWTQIYNRAQT